jgi:YbbR domain-containing protein
MFMDFLPGKNTWARLVSKDWLLKFVSLVLAVILWYYVGGENRVDKNVMIPIEIINLPRDLVISNQFKKEIEVTVSGPRALILDMSNKAITRQVDLSAATPGTMVIENTNQHIPVPRGITVQRVQPSSIILSLDKLIQKRFPVSAKTVGRPARGYVLKGLHTEPDVISITGPQTILSRIDELYTNAVNLDGLKQSTQLQIPLELDPSIVDLIGETSVTADISIGLETVTKTVSGMKVHVLMNGGPGKVVPDVVKVTANIPKLLLDEKVDLQKLFMVTAIQQQGMAKLKVEVIPRPDIEYPIEIVSIIPSAVEFADEIYPDNGSVDSIVPLGKLKGGVLQEKEPPGAENMEENGKEGSPLLIRSIKKKKKPPEKI